MAAGTAAGLLLIMVQAAAVGGWSGLLQVGESSSLRGAVTEEIPDLVTVRGGGHDGQIYYAIGLDPTGRFVPRYLEDAGYRYRRILLPLLASLGGTLGGKGLVISMALWSAVGLGLAAGALRTLTFPSRGTMVLLFANPATWLSVWMLTPDALALGLTLVGLWQWRRRPLIGWSFLSLAILAKEQYFLAVVVLALAELASRRFRPGLFALASGLPLAAWGSWVELAVGDGFTPRGNLTIPFMGVLSGARVWANTPTTDQVLVGIALAGVAVAFVAGWIRRRSLWGWLALAWAGLALSSSDWVWAIGNNAARVFVGCWVFGGCAIALRDYGFRATATTLNPP